MLRTTNKTGSTLRQEIFKYLTGYQRELFSPNAIFLSTAAKYMLLVSRTRFGQVQTDKGNKNLLQKDFKKLIIPENIDYDFADIMFDMIWKAGTAKEELIKGTQNMFIVNELFKVFDYCYMEEVFNLSKIQQPLFFKRILTSTHEYRMEDSVGLYQKVLMDPDNVLRNNMKLFTLRYRQHILEVEDIIQKSMLLLVNRT